MSALTLEAIAAGLREALRIKRGYQPIEGDLADASLISDWMIEPLPAGLYRLIGRVRGHPSVRGGWRTTSPALAVDPAGTWMRTASRCHRLGPALEVRQ